MNNDRVTELYEGRISSDEGQRICRDRIDWMVAQVHGPRVLDIGCSQGIASLLAARAGHTVLGVDVEEPAIEYARRALAREPAAVRERVQFLLSDIHATDLDGAVFDTVLLCEILEHHADPRRLFERAVQFLAPGGVIVVSTPFGYHPHEDHKVTIYLSDFARIIDGLCAPSALEVADGYIRFLGRHRDALRRGEPVAALDAAALLALSERGFLNKEQTVYELRRLHLQQSARRVEALDGQVKRLYATLQEQRTAASELSAQRKTLIAGLRAELKRQRRQIKRARRLPPILPAPARVGRFSRALAMVFGSLQHELHTGRALRRPHLALYKTAVRAGKALRTPPPSVPAMPRAPAPPPAVDAPRVSAPADSAPAPAFPPFHPLVSPPTSSSLTIATILDTFSESCFRYEANLIALTTDGWRAEMERHRPAFLLAESAWLGNGGQWQYLFSQYLKRENNPLRELLAWCRASGVPSVFWNKEDPANFDVFKDVAAEFDHVFTTDEDCIPRYRALLGHDRIHALPFAAQPAIHNPMQDELERRGSVCFAGSWRARKYPERAADAEILLQPALEFGLDIYDRNAASKKADELAFPPPYRDAVRGSLDYDAMLSAYRSYKTFLNVNSVKESPTMFARRVFELMACGTPVVSGDSVGIREMLGSLVKVATTAEEARTHLRRLLGDDDYRGRYAHAGYREVFERHTYRDRMRAILDVLGIDAPAAAPPLVTILAGTNRPERLDNLLASVRRQVHPNLEVFILLNADGFDLGEVERACADLPGARVFQLPPSYTLAECLNHGLDHASGAWVAKFDDDDWYGAHYVSDLLLATRYTDAAILGKRSCFCFLEGTGQLALRFPDKAHQHVEFVPGATLFVRRDVFEQVRFVPVKQGTDSAFQRDCRQLGFRIYSADPYNFVIRRQADATAHTWQITDEQMLAKSRVVADRLAMDLVMI